MRLLGICVRSLGLFLLMGICYSCQPPEVGSRDCAVLQDLPSGAYCDQCQGVSCEEADPDNPSECAFFPCVDDTRVVQGCTEDMHCAEFDGMFCGMGTSLHWHMCGIDMGDF